MPVGRIDRAWTPWGQDEPLAITSDVRQRAPWLLGVDVVCMAQRSADPYQGRPNKLVDFLLDTYAHMGI